MVIVMLTAIAVGMVELRRQEVVMRHEAQEWNAELHRQRQLAYGLDVRLGDLTSPQALLNRKQEMGIPMEAPSSSPVSHEPALKD